MSAKKIAHTRRQLINAGGWFFLINSLIGMIISCRDFQYLPPLSGFLPYFYLISTEITHIALLAYLSFLILFIPFVLILNNRVSIQITSVVVASLGLIGLLVDSVVFNLYHFHINDSVLEMLFGSSPKDVFQINFSQYILALIIISVLLLCEHFLFKTLYKLALKQKLFSSQYFLVPLIALWVTVNGIYAWANATKKTDIVQLSEFYPAFYQFENTRMLCKLHIVTPKDTISKEFQLRKPFNLNYPKHPLEFKKLKKSPNFLFILIDSWNYQVLNAMDMPNVYAFSRKSDFFAHHYTGSNCTQYGLFSLMYSLPGGFYWDKITESHTPTVLFDELQRRDYDFFIRTSATLKNPPFNQNVFYPVKDELKDMNGEEAYDRDMQIMHEWLRFTDGREQIKDPKPFFGFLFFDDLHAICQPPFFKKRYPTEWDYAHYEYLNNDYNRSTFFNLYRNIALFEDSLIQKVLIDLKERKLLDNTVVVITADHGQEFNENKKNYWGHNSNYSKYQLQVPFIIHYPHVTPHTYNEWTSHYDVVPTLMTKFLKCKSPTSDYSVGFNMYGEEERTNLLVTNANPYSLIGIVEKDKIITIQNATNYNVTDQKLNFIPRRIDFDRCNLLIRKNMHFFK